MTTRRCLAVAVPASCRCNGHTHLALALAQAGRSPDLPTDRQPGDGSDGVAEVLCRQEVRAQAKPGRALFHGIIK
jgi:hypothetical protein